MKLFWGIIGLLIMLVVAAYIVSKTILCDDTKFVCMDVFTKRHFVLAGLLFSAALLVLNLLRDDRDGR